MHPTQRQKGWRTILLGMDDPVLSMIVQNPHSDLNVAANDQAGRFLRAGSPTWAACEQLLVALGPPGVELVLPRRRMPIGPCHTAAGAGPAHKKPVFGVGKGVEKSQSAPYVP